MLDACRYYEQPCSHDCILDDGIHCCEWRDENGLTWREHCERLYEKEDYGYD